MTLNPVSYTHLDVYKRQVVVGRLAEVRFIDVNTGIILSTHNVPYGSKLYAADGDIVEKGKLIAKWDPFNACLLYTSLVK